MPESDPSQTFETLGLAPELLQSLDECGYTTPTPIQAKAIPHLLTGRDLMGCAQTGTGKTAAFALPILQQIRGLEPGRLRALVLVPTRELAMQVQKNVQEYGRNMNLRSTAVYGGVPFEPQIMMLRHGVDVLVATPGRLKDHIWRGLIDFRDTQFLVLDEADRMLDLGFIDAVREIVDLMPTERQTMLFSATLEPAIVKLARDILHDPVRVEVAPSATVAEGVEHRIVTVSSGEKRSALVHLMREHRMERTLVFTKTRRGAQALASHLGREGHRVASIHSDKTQAQRTAALSAFRTGRIQVLVATDIAARGLDVTGISHVINFDVPHHAEDYVHRIGRTARAGKSGIAISLVTPQDGESLRSIEHLIGMKLGAGSKPGSNGGGPKPSLATASAAPPTVSRRIERGREPRADSARTARRRPDGSGQEHVRGTAERVAIRRPSSQRSSGSRAQAERAPAGRTGSDRGPETRPAPRQAGHENRPRREAAPPARRSEPQRPAPGKPEGALRRMLNRIGLTTAR